MKLLRLLLAGVVLAGVVTVAVVSQAAETPAAKMTAAADKFLTSLNAEQKAKAGFSFDDKERTNWHFVPMQTRDRKPTRKGLPLQEMTKTQREAARELLKAGTSVSGFGQAETIMQLEAILRDLEKGGAMVRNPEWYFVSIFGTPSQTGKWGWRIEGHHLSLNFTLDKGKVVSATPAFFGANPATIKQGPRKGYQTLAQSENLARELADSLDAEQKKAALQDRQFDEIEQAKARPNVGKPRGLAAGKMSEKQKGLLTRLVKAYAGRLSPEIGSAKLARVEKAGWDRIHFAYFVEADKPGKPLTYRVQGPTFVIEFLNVQKDSAGNPANHIHSSWRNLDGDFALASD